MGKSQLSGLILPLLISFALMGGCVPKSNEALKRAEDAIAEAEAAGAAEKAPVPYQLAKNHLADGKAYDTSFRYNLAICEYESAAESAALALAMSGETVEVPLLEPSTCCPELDMCKAEVEGLTKKLYNCRQDQPVVTRVIRKECPEPAAGPSLVGMLLYEPPAGIEKGREKYTIKARFEASSLGGAARSDDLRILIDILETGPEGVEASSPMSDYQALSPGTKWELPVTVPADAKGPVKVKIGATLWNAATQKEQKLPPYTAVIPSLAGCPECAECPPAGPAEKEGANWAMFVILLAVGLVAGVIVGFLAAGRKKQVKL